MKKSILKVKRLDIPDNIIIFDMASLEELYAYQGKDELLVETDAHACNILAKRGSARLYRSLSCFVITAEFDSGCHDWRP